jgi:hypothetical protein
MNFWKTISRPLFRTVGDRSGKALTGNALRQEDAYRMIRRRAKTAGIRTKNRQPHFPPDRHHGVPEERRQAGDRAADGQS